MSIHFTVEDYAKFYASCGDYVKYAKKHFEHTSDESVRCKYYIESIRKDGVWYREVAAFDKVTFICTVYDDLKCEKVIDSVYSEVPDQQAEIDAVIHAYESCKPGLPASDRRNKHISRSTND